LESTLAEGVKALTDYLPDYFACANIAKRSCMEPKPQ